ncbi:MAG TPA: FG-GAP-like repeat-containing protein [Terriglobales bacterium]|jgi:tetratricopeptide (TPR) repeat protein
MSQTRREFLLRCCQGASAAFFPSGISPSWSSPFQASQTSFTESGFHLHPHYRAQLPIDATLLKVKTGSDDFISEKYAEEVAAVFDQWTTELKRSPTAFDSIKKALAPGFAGGKFAPVKSRTTRSGPVVQAELRDFSPELVLENKPFMVALQSWLEEFTEILTAEFQVTSIHVNGNSLQTTVRYELVGRSKDIFREQRTGEWFINWILAGGDQLTIRSWHGTEERRSAAAQQVFADVTAQYLGKNDSYQGQMLKGVDYWRTVLDGACGIDIYGHNGVSVADIDGDGLDDLYVCQPAGLPNRLYRNRGDGTFEDITELSGLGVIENTSCALFADFNNSGRQDVIVVRTNGPLLFLNQGRGKFTLKPDAFQFANPPRGTFTGAAVADYDRDGWLDVYFCLYLYYQGTGQYKYPSPYYAAENGPPNFLMRNNRDGTFQDVTNQAGLNQNNTRYSFCCAWNDYNRDGWPDLYVVNDFGRKNLYRNNRDGTFTDVAAQTNLEDVGAGMSVCWLDYNNDGKDDLYIANMWTAAGLRVSEQDMFQKDSATLARGLYRKHAMGNSMFKNKGDGTFDNVSNEAGIQMGRWSWSSDAWDFDHDGFSDIYVTNGMVSGISPEDLNSFFWRQVVANSPAEVRPSADYEQGWNAINDLLRSDGTWSGCERNVFYANNRDGTFSDVSGAIGLDFLEDGRAFALADIDRDGRLEVIVKNRNSPQIRILQNIVPKLGSSISFRLSGVKSNRDGIGAKITVETASHRQTRSLQAGSGFVSQHSKELFFGLGEDTGTLRATIAWPSGTVQELHDLPVGHRIWVREGTPPERVEPFAKTDFRHTQPIEPSTAEALPETVETWLIAPIPAPDFSLPDLNGTVVSLATFRGRPLFLHLWALGSSTSAEPVKLLQQLQAKGLPAVAVNLDDQQNRDRVRAMSRGFSLRVLWGSDDFAGIYNTLYRYLFDRHRDLTLPTSFLIDHTGSIVKVYQGPFSPPQVERDSQNMPKTSAERQAKALPFPGVADSDEFRRNYLSYGSVYFQREYFDQAFAAFELALSGDPTSAEATYGIGSVYLKQNRLAEARESFERATKLVAGYPDTLPNSWNNLGLLQANAGNIDDAIANFEEALKLNPEHPIALLNLGNAYRRKQQWDKARQILERAVAAHPQDAEANYSLAMVFAQSDDSEHAYEYLQKALKYRPDYPEALNNLGVLYLRTRRRDEAVHTFEECIRVAPDFDQAYLNLAQVYAIEGATEKARAILLDLLKHRPGNAAAERALTQLPH